VSIEGGQLLLPGHIPQDDLAASRPPCLRVVQSIATGQGLAVGTEGETGDTVETGQKVRAILSEGNVPQSYRLITASRRQRFPIRAEGHDLDLPAVAVEDAHLLARPEIPEPDDVPGPYRGQRLAVRRQGIPGKVLPVVLQLQGRLFVTCHRLQ
jgi:hypothetical protein